ncbi:hypothetical protein KZZ07_19655 [Mameliella sp. CS4]|uniref:hypothetical protein n=1 Tax=Mameliella sp. CS4 TaxID=2862329 RepID=UPI001C5FF2AC|nr:hypothetical protein [Mameliella sp. CS4]MBW4984760.1 hypothetical protein [Mameliella sp. CS4]
MKKPRHRVSDYALLQYIETVTGVEVEALRQVIAARADAAGTANAGMYELASEDLRFYASGGTVCGVRAKNARE